MHYHDKQYLLTMHLFGLFLKCPFREATADCPFSDIRKMHSLELKFKLAEKMACHPRCQENLCNTHEACYRKRMLLVDETCQARSATSTRHRGNTPVCQQAGTAQR